MHNQSLNTSPSSAMSQNQQQPMTGQISGMIQPSTAIMFQQPQIKPQPQNHLQQPFLLASPQFPVPQPINTMLNQPQTPIQQSSSRAPISLAEMASIISPMSRRRAEGFVLKEIKLMLEEINRRRDILLSISPATNRLKRRAWEEVANAMAQRWPQETRRTGEQIKKKWENLVSKTKRKVRDGHMTPDFDWNETNTLVMQFLASATAAMRVKQQQQVESSVTSAYLMEAGGNANSIGGYAYPGSGFSSAVFPSVSNNTTNINNPGSTDASFSGVNTGNGGSSGSNCKSEDQANKNQVTIDDSSNDEGTTADEAERNDESSSVNNNQHGMPPWACIGVDESLLSHLTPLGPTNPLTSLNFGQFGSSTSLMQQEELMQQAREEHRLKIEVLHLQKRAWQMKVDQLSRYISSNTNADVNMGVSAGDEMM